MRAAVTLTEAVTKLSVKLAVVKPLDFFSLPHSSFTSTAGETRSRIPSSRCSPELPLLWLGESFFAWYTSPCFPSFTTTFGVLLALLLLLLLFLASLEKLPLLCSLLKLDTGVSVTLLLLPTLLMKLLLELRLARSGLNLGGSSFGS
jgi:hypothetical protein